MVARRLVTPSPLLRGLANPSTRGRALATPSLRAQLIERARTGIRNDGLEILEKVECAQDSDEARHLHRLSTFETSQGASGQPGVPRETRLGPVDPESTGGQTSTEPDERFGICHREPQYKTTLSY